MRALSMVVCVVLLIGGLACETPSDGPAPTPTPTGNGNENPNATPTPDPQPTATPSPVDQPGAGETPTPAPTPTPDPGDDMPGPTPTPTATPEPGEQTDPDDPAERSCLPDQVPVSVSGACDLDGSGLGCCPDGFPLVTEDCFCVAELDDGPAPTPTPTPPPFNCPAGQVLVAVTPDCALDDTNYVCCPEDLARVDEECFCVESAPPE
jgi:hypothetical protein